MGFLGTVTMMESVGGHRKTVSDTIFLRHFLKMVSDTIFGQHFLEMVSDTIFRQHFERQNRGQSRRDSPRR